MSSSAFGLLKISNQDNLQESMSRGAIVYEDFCVNCHMANGEGVPSTFPPLKNSDYLNSKREASIRAIKYGLKGKIQVNGDTYNGYMASLGLDNEEVADVMNYINNSWGNTNDTIVTVKDVALVKK